MNNSAALPAISQVPLPAAYAAARTAIAECERIDECKTWADKAAVMKAYAIMRDDRTLHNHALRIQLRAERRCGELLKQIEPAKNQHGSLPTRAETAREAGLSDRQRKTALRVASVSQDKFEAAVESDTPPTTTQLANQGKVSRGPEPSEDAARPVNESSWRTLAQFAKFCDENEPVRLAWAVDSEQAESLRLSVGKIDRWLDRFVTNLPK
jgi:hypothetical protein